jgi:hypothetical protein
VGVLDGTSDAVVVLFGRRHEHKPVSTSNSCSTTQLLLEICPAIPNAIASIQVRFATSSSGMTSLSVMVPLMQMLHSEDVGFRVKVGAAEMVGKAVVVGSNVEVMVGCTVVGTDDDAVPATGDVVVDVLVVGDKGAVGTVALMLVGVMVGESKVTPPTGGVGTAVGATVVDESDDGASGSCIEGNSSATTS